MAAITNEKGWVHVEFICDKNKADVPLSFLENFDKLDTFELNKTYNVFWSPNEEDTPSSIKEREGKVLKIDKIKRATKNTTIPIAGYYSAILLHIADSEENLHKKMELQRTRRVPLHLLDSEQTHSSNASENKSSKRKEHDKEAAREANFKRICVDENTDETKEKLKVRVEGLEATVNSLDGLYKDSLEKINALQKENETLRKNNTDLCEENTTLRKLNIFWQEEIQKCLKAPKCINTVHTIPNIEQTAAQSDKLNFLQPLIEKGYEEENIEAEDVEAEDKEIDDKDIEDKEVRDDLEQGFRLSEEQFKACNAVPSGKSGDSKFIKNITDLLWSREELSMRSVTGTQCPNNKNFKARPECTPAKKLYLSELLQRRIEMEAGGSGDTEVEARRKKINEYLRSKIKTVRRDLKIN